MAKSKSGKGESAPGKTIVKGGSMQAKNQPTPVSKKGS